MGDIVKNCILFCKNVISLDTINNQSIKLLIV